MTQSFLSRVLRPRMLRHPYTLPDGLRVYAVGDVHGRADCLNALERRLFRFHAAAAPVRDALVIFLGDYVDRGPSSREVLDRLASPGFAGMPARYLLGNHDEAMLRFLDDVSVGPEWLAFGGMATLASYGVGVSGTSEADRLVSMQQGLRKRLPVEHRLFLEALELWVEIGSYLFVHAGVRPGVTLDKQRRGDLLGIRDAFLQSNARLPWRVVHGHTVFRDVQIASGRISLDTGAYASGILSCVAIEGDVVTVLPC